MGTRARNGVQEQFPHSKGSIHREAVCLQQHIEVASKEIVSLRNGVKMAIPTEVEDRLLVLERLFEVRLKFVGSTST